ncbi:MAG: AAA family ATPase [Sediminibacterium sp.]|uniref:AAA family ATPase n=1 Tax=Sediminibacterium sp. TaxID=1917865 RepID=UPI0027164A27|nr:AAA family ATPase [Sediminibacterium sp.]MDO8996503.1 AAA family ATPase [Sediminibacterium sp.]
MRIDKIHIQNFRGIEDLEINLHKQFNLLIGENGSGKTAILEALTVAIGSFFSGIPGVQSRHIRDADIRYFRAIEGSYEYSSITKVEVLNAFINGKDISWYKERNGVGGSNIMGKGSPIRILSEELNKSIKDSKRKTLIDLPVLAYYSTARLWKEGRENKKEKFNESIVKNLPTRYRGYKDALEIKSTFKIMLDWFKSKFQDKVVNDTTSVQLECVRDVIIKNIPRAKNVKWVFDKDKIQTLYIVFEDEHEIPFQFLSDGYRNLLAIFADLAYRCVTLNPHFGKDANLNSKGVVLIDELDLHLHPAWQKTIVNQLKDTFPNIQFVATTHSPFIIQETNEGELFRLQNNGQIIIGGANEYSLEDIAEYVQMVKDPAWSIRKKEMYEAAKEYFELLQKLTPITPPEELNLLRERLNILGKAYSDNVAYTAFLEQKRFLAEGKLN